MTKNLCTNMEKKFYNPTEYTGSYQGMETECVHWISLRKKYDYQIIGYCHNRDRYIIYDE